LNSGAQKELNSTSGISQLTSQGYGNRDESYPDKAGDNSCNYPVTTYVFA